MAAVSHLKDRCLTAFTKSSPLSIRVNIDLLAGSLETGVALSSDLYDSALRARHQGCQSCRLSSEAINHGRYRCPHARIHVIGVGALTRWKRRWSATGKRSLGELVVGLEPQLPVNFRIGLAFHAQDKFQPGSHPELLGVFMKDLQYTLCAAVKATFFNLFTIVQQ